MESTVAAPMSLALVIESFTPTGGGAERSTLQIARELQRRGHRVTILCRGPFASGEHDLDGVGVESLGRAGSSSALGLARFAHWARRRITGGGYDASLSVTTAVPASVLQPRSGTVVEAIDRNVATRRGPLARLSKRLAVALSPKQHASLVLERRAIADPLVRRFVAISDYVRRQLQGHYGVPPQRIEVIANAAVMPEATQEERRAWREAVRAGFRVPEASTAFLFVANDPRRKGFDPLLRATAELKRRGLPVAVLLAGEMGYAHQRAAAAAGVRELVRMVRQTQHAPALYCAADVTVLPTFNDPSSKVVIESLMLGTPAISTAYNGASDFITHGGRLRGRVVADPADWRGLAEAMAALTDPAERRRCAEATADLAEQLTMRRHVDQLERVLAEAAG